MSPAKVAVACVLTALLVSACGIPPKPEAGSPNLLKNSAFRGVVDDPRTPHVACLRADKVPFHEFYTAKQHLPAIQVGSLPSGPTIIFYPTPGIAQGLQIMGQEQGAEVIGSALVYPNQASNSVINDVEQCMAIGVSG
ncbi:hypothetical protein [Conexibacter sp. S30A1]|uniref:hypothetical protein n=1 Tax=Conexibacter sp. S30A1 TaxID=2937800 RepID=UPI00200E2A08|nr:hypothetical protein [Conexibacter sp. S30A1]